VAAKGAFHGEARLKTGAETASAPVLMATAAWVNMNASGEVKYDDKNMLYRFALQVS
jgi:alkyl hydroperoxide reductase subunit AhpF